MSELPPEASAPPPPLPPIPWELPGVPAVRGLLETIQLFFTRPREGFERMPISSDLVRPLMYALIIGWPTFAVSQLYDLAFKSFLGGSGMFQGRMSEMGLGGSVFQTMVLIVIAPILIFLWLFIWSGIVHLFLMMLGGVSAGYLATCRAICYASTVQVLNLVPICGGLVAIVWGLVLQIIGVATVHRTSTGKAAAAVLLPLLLCCTCIGVLFAFMGATIFSMLQNR